jgi:hypothetical protein
VTIPPNNVSMLQPTKKSLIVELVVCFGPLIPLLVLGLLVAPVQLMMVGTAPSPNWLDAVIGLGQVACGLIGLASLAYVVSKLFEGHGSISRPTLVCIGTAIGALAVTPMLLSSSLGWTLVGLLPLIASLHILFLARRMLFSSWRDATKKAVLAIAVVLPLATIPMLDPARTSGSTLLQQRELWKRAAPERYAYTVQLSGYPTGWRKPAKVLTPMRMTVEHGQVTSAIYLWDGGSHHKAGDTAPKDSLWTIERAFGELLAAEDEGWIVHTRFNDTWGYVENAYVKPRDEEPLSGWGLEVRDFQVEVPALEPRPAQRGR